MEGFWSVVAAAAATLSALNVAPQLVKSWRTKRTGDLSYGMLGVVMSGNVLWVIHGLHRRDVALATANAILFSTALALLRLKMTYDRRAGPSPGSPGVR